MPTTDLARCPGFIVDQPRFQPRSRFKNNPPASSLNYGLFARCPRGHRSRRQLFGNNRPFRSIEHQHPRPTRARGLAVPLLPTFARGCRSLFFSLERGGESNFFPSLVGPNLDPRSARGGRFLRTDASSRRRRKIWGSPRAPRDLLPTSAMGVARCPAGQGIRTRPSGVGTPAPRLRPVMIRAFSF